MQLPRYKKKKKKLKLKVCQEPGCGKEYFGHVISKYCDEHRDIAKRVRRRKKGLEFEGINREFRHGYKETTIAEFTCTLEGCNDKYEVILFPKQFVYPAFCVEHRSHFKRELFARQRRTTLQHS